MKTVVGIDIGGTRIKAGLVDDKGRILKRVSPKTKANSGRNAIINQLKHIIENLIEKNTIGVGIGSPGIIDKENGKVLAFGLNIKNWAGTRILKDFEEVYPYLIWCADNDAHCAAYGEIWQGSAKKLDSFIMLTLGTGLGSAISFNKRKIYHGNYSMAGELGHMILIPGGRKCNCGQRGCAEQYLSITALRRLYKEKTGKKLKGTVFSKIHKEETAAYIVKKFQYLMGIYLINLSRAFDTEAIIIGGGLLYDKDIWWKGVKNVFYQKTNNVPKQKLLVAEKLNDAGILGASYLVFKEGEKNGFKDIIS